MANGLDPIPICDPEELMDDAECFDCLTTLELDWIITWALCQWANEVTEP